MAVLVFLDPDPGLDLSFDDILGVGDGRWSTVRQGHSSTARPRRAPAIESSSYPSGVVGGSKQEAISMAGSTPMLTEMAGGGLAVLPALAMDRCAGPRG